MLEERCCQNNQFFDDTVHYFDHPKLDLRVQLDLTGFLEDVSHSLQKASLVLNTLGEELDNIAPVDPCGVSNWEKLQFEPPKTHQKWEDLLTFLVHHYLAVAGMALMPVMSILWLRCCSSIDRLQHLAFRLKTGFSGVGFF